MTQERDNGYRIQPDKFIPDSKDPFANDLMGRKPQADALVKLATSVSGPAVIAVDAPYGVGKSTFLRMFALSPELRDAADVIEHNAWETEVGDMPPNSLSSEIIASAQSPDAVQLLREISVPGTRATLALVGEITQLFGDESGAALTAINVAGSLAQKAPDAIDRLKDFRQKLSRYISQKRIVIIIDELDRCTPTYAIETLEAIHHIFDSDGITFVLGLHRQQLMESIKAIYGQGFDAEGYLDRFIDMTIPLSSSRDDFIKAKLGQHIGANGEIYRSDYAQQLLMAMPNINARSIDRFAKNLIAVMNVMPSNVVGHTLRYDSAYVTACTALGVKIISPSRYKAFNEYRASDNDIYNLLGMNQIPLQEETALAAAILIAAQVDISLSVSYPSDNDKRQQIRLLLDVLSDESKLSQAIILLKRHSPLCEQFSSIPDPIVEWLNQLTDMPRPRQKLSHWQEVTDIIDLTT